MKETIREQTAVSIGQLRLPRYTEIPDVGLYLEQTVKYIDSFLAPLPETALTASMVSNYVKKGLIANPVKRCYGREQIAHLIFIALAKSVLSLDSIRKLIRMGLRNYTPERAYDYFCSEFENLLQFVFEVKEVLEEIGAESSEEKQMLRNVVIAMAHKFYLDQLLCNAEEALLAVESDDPGHIRAE